MPAPFKKCDVCGGKVPVQDPHSSCLLCLGKDHNPKACSLCKSLSSQARKNRESRLTSAIAQGKVQEGGSRPSLTPSAAPPVSSSQASMSSVVSAPLMAESSSTTNVARGSQKPSATEKPSKHLQKSSGAEGSEPRAKSGRKLSPEGSRLRDRSEVEALPVPVPPSKSKSSRHASKLPKTGAPSAPKKAVVDKGRSSKPSTAAAVVLSDLPDNPFFPLEDRETPCSSKKRHSKETLGDSGSKKSRSSHGQSGASTSSKGKECLSHKSRSPEKKARSPTKKAYIPASVPSHPDESSTSHMAPLLDTLDMDFAHLNAEVVGALREQSPPLSFHSEENEPVDEDDEPVDESTDMFYDSETGKYYMSVPKETAFRKFTQLNLHPVAPRREKPQTSHLAASRSDIPSRPAACHETELSALQIPTRPASRVRAPDIQLSSGTDSDEEPLSPVGDPSGEDDTSIQASPQRMHHPEPSSPTDDVRSFNEHIIKMARALDIELSFPDEQARDPVERRVHGRVPTQPSIPLLPSLKTIVRRSWDVSTSLVGSLRRIESLYRIAPSSCSWLTDHPKPYLEIVEGA
ncbi:mucin-5AC-like [Sceloporus undulatus]|uniref:mucin-5AC-like n=1 Tax=Sceloporus undulatus TaxID=8520 RepID=UPI001C4D6375|nr:mucin-5AC-like [Sceloporus undulatus]